MSDNESSSEEEEFTGEDMDQEEEEEDFNDDEEEDRKMPARRASRERAAPTSYAEDDDDEDDEEESSDDDDDVPLSALVAKKKKPSPAKKKAAAPAKKKKATTNGNATKKRKTSASSSSKATTSSSSSSKSYESASAALYGTECTKGLLVQRLLCRWWYAIEWPDTSQIPATPPDHYDSLDGFPGVFVCTSSGGEHDVGHLLDLRNAETAPSFVNLIRKPAEELQTLLLQALQKQKSELIQSEGAGTSTEKELQQLIKWTQKVNPTKAEKEAVKVLKAHRLSLP